jgi:hypothetical protein
LTPVVLFLSDTPVLVYSFQIRKVWSKLLFNFSKIEFISTILQELFNRPANNQIEHVGNKADEERQTGTRLLYDYWEV